MKKFLFLFLSASIAITGCKKDDDNPPSEDAIKTVHQLAILTAEARSTFLEFVPTANGDPRIALMQTLDWIVQQDGVESAFHQDSVYLFFKMTNGLQSMVWFKEVDAQGASKFRGSGSGVLKAITAADCNHEVTNKDVLIYAPGSDEFLYELRSQVPGRLASSNLIDDVFYLKNELATVDIISTFSGYGLVLMETHGTALSFLTGEAFEFGQSEIPEDFEQFSASVLGQIGQQNLDHLLSGKLIVGGEIIYDPLDSDWWTNNQGAFEAGKFTLWATAKLLEGIPSLNNTIVIGNFCFSGWVTEVDNYPKPIGLGFQNLDPISYYCYQRPNGMSKPVDNVESMALEDSVIVGLLTDNDHTGIAHLKSDETKFQTTYPDLTLEHIGQPDWCYESCSEDLVFGGQTYRTVCIGDQIWMAENLRYLPVQHTDQEFADASDNETPGYGAYPGEDIQVFGALYNWYAASDNICPSGWHLPSQEEWTQLAQHTGFISEAGAKLKSQNYWNSPSFSTDEYGFSAVGGGERGDFLGDFREIGIHGKYWTSTDVGPGIAKAAGFTYNADSFQSGNTGKGIGKSCRCVKD